MRLLPRSLTARLVATLVLVVLATTVLVSVVTGLVMRGYLTGQLDDQVRQTLHRSTDSYDRGFGTPPPGSGAGTGGTPGQGSMDDGDADNRPRFGIGDGTGTLTAVFASSEQPFGFVLRPSSGSRPTPHRLSGDALSALRSVPTDGRSHVVELPHLGTFLVRAVTVASRVVVAGQSTGPLDDAVGSLVLSELLVGVGAIVIAALVGRVLVRRQLRPLREVSATAHEVATLPLSSGAIGTTVRVPDELTDERSEVGQVGSALNTMLAHVELALDERHRSEQQVRQFVADASHELRTPLTTIHGYAELSRRTQPADPAQLSAAMAKVESEATRMSSLVEDLLLLARLDAGRPLARDEVDLTRLVLEAVGDARVVGPDHRWRLDLPDEPVDVPGDEQRLHQVLTNLLNNARRHTPPGTSVVVGVHRDDADDAVELSVEDDGPGLSPDLVGSAFERFTRGDSARTRESGGAGLGLSLVQAITVAHGGRANVESRPGRTRFVVRLPGLPADAAAPTPVHR